MNYLLGPDSNFSTVFSSKITAAKKKKKRKNQHEGLYMEKKHRKTQSELSDSYHTYKNVWSFLLIKFYKNNCLLRVKKDKGVVVGRGGTSQGWSIYLYHHRYLR